MKFLAKKTLAVCCLLIASQSALASETLSSANTAWILTSTALVLFMTIPGLSLFYGGLVRVKNVLSVLMQCFAITCMVSVLWLIGAYSLAFSEGNALIGGLDNMFFANVTEGSMSGDIPESVFAMFQLTFAIITPALIVGAFAERMKFASMMLFSAIWLIVVYAPVTHWVWGGGWLGEMGLLDFAGGTVVHVTAGAAALVCALVMGPRKGFPTTAMPPHNLTMAMTGAGMLWVGWFGFNAGSTLGATDLRISVVATNTFLGAAGGAALVIFVSWIAFGFVDLGMVCNGALGGLVAITGPCAYVPPWAAVTIGILAGAIMWGTVIFVETQLKIDDPLGAVAVHGANGIWGMLAIGIFADGTYGGVSGCITGSIGQLQAQTIGAAAAIRASFASFSASKAFAFVSASTFAKLSFLESTFAALSSNHA